MENESAKRRRRAAADSKDDRISKLPELILHHIFCFLSQRTAARTSVLSKAWRYLWCTRPKIDFRDGITVVAGENKESFLSVLDRTLRFYHDREIRLQQLTLQLSSSEGETGSFIRKWIRILVQSMGVSQFHLDFVPIDYILNRRMQLSLSIFRSESLLNLSLKNCVLKSISPAAPPLHLKHLRNLTLQYVNIPEEILDDILSNCPFVEYVSLTRCTGFRRIELKHPASLKEFRFNDDERGDTCFATGGGDISTLRSIYIEDCLLSFNPNRQFYFSQLTHLTMRYVTLSSTDLFSCSLPCLEELILDYCCGIEEFNLSSPSMKRMEIHNPNSPFKITVDAPSIVSFRYKGVLPQSISFSAAAATSWKSYIDLTSILKESLLCLNDLIGLLKALSQSEIFVNLLQTTVQWLRNQFLDTSVGVSYDDLPLVVDHLIVAEPKYYSLTAWLQNQFLDTSLGLPSAGDFFNSLFLIIRPKFIYMSCYIKGLNKTQRVTEMNLKAGEMYRREFWQPFLDGAVSMQVFYSNRGGKWEPFEPEILSKLISNKGESMDQSCLPIDMDRRIKLMIFN